MQNVPYVLTHAHIEAFVQALVPAHDAVHNDTTATIPHCSTESERKEVGVPDGRQADRKNSF